MYKQEIFFNTEKMVEWLNNNKSIEVLQIIPTLNHKIFVLIYWEPEPQPQQKDLIPESDKPESL